MTRGVGEAALAAALPDAVVALAALLTTLGGVWFALLLVAALAAARRSPFDTSPSTVATLTGSSSSPSV